MNKQRVTWIFVGMLIVLSGSFMVGLTLWSQNTWLVEGRFIGSEGKRLDELQVEFTLLDGGEEIASRTVNLDESGEFSVRFRHAGEYVLMSSVSPRRYPNSWSSSRVFTELPDFMRVRFESGNRKDFGNLQVNREIEIIEPVDGESYEFGNVRVSWLEVCRAEWYNVTISRIVPDGNSVPVVQAYGISETSITDEIIWNSPLVEGTLTPDQFSAMGVFHRVHEEMVPGEFTVSVFAYRNSETIGEPVVLSRSVRSSQPTIEIR
ncbi:MAG: hypothetical protein EA383_15750 [Spirochaetaceae bacterium]|nr:MAG: hypothetical protein EA383_15750 [Spirochaetaceae bacterium]